MLWFAAWTAALLYLIPPGVLLIARSRRDRPLWEIALDLPLGVALDVMILLALARIMRLETAVLISRPLWLIGGTVWALRARRRRTLAWPRALGKTELLTAALAVTLSVWLSTAFSRDCHSFDRGWHIPLATSIRGQLLPFENVYEPGRTFAYHFTGDVVAAALQTLSGVTIHMSLALSMSHDVVFALIGACSALLLCWCGMRSPGPVALLVQAPLLAGPANLLVSTYSSTAGHNFINLLKLSFRPHTALALLLLIGLFGAMLVRARSADDPPPLWRTASILVAMAALLAVTDEASVGLVGLSLGVTWLVFPEIVAGRRLHGIAVLAAMLVALMVSNLLFHGALFAGVGQAISWVPARAPGYYRAPLPLETAVAQVVLWRDLFPIVLLWLAGAMIVVRDRNRARLATFAFVSVLILTSVVGLTHIDIGERAVESHRFMTGALVLTTMAAITWLAPPFRGSREPLGIPHTIALIGMALAAVGSLDWLIREGDPSSGKCTHPSLYYATQDLFEVNCRMIGARFGEMPAPMYLDKPIAYAVSGCRPVFTSGPPAPVILSDRLDLPKGRRVQQWNTKIGRMLVDAAALRDIDADMLPPEQPLVAACHRRTQDPVCLYALERNLCEDFAWVSTCTIPADQRPQIVANARYRPPPPPPRPAPGARPAPAPREPNESD